MDLRVLGRSRREPGAGRARPRPAGREWGECYITARTPGRALRRGVEQFQLLSPTIALTATGGIQHEEGSDIFDSPLELTAHLDMLGRGAAILYSMDLMQDERNELGYWRGPEIRIWGTPADSHTNFEEVINQAADGTTKGAFTRPIAGIIGNLKYRWFDSDSRKREAQTESKREERIEQLEAEAPAGPAAP